MCIATSFGNAYLRALGPRVNVLQLIFVPALLQSEVVDEASTHMHKTGSRHAALGLLLLAALGVHVCVHSYEFQPLPYVGQ